MKNNNKGIIEPFTLLAIVSIIGAILFVPNPIRTTLGLEQKPNTVTQKQSYSEKLVPVMVNGEQVGFKTVTTENIDNSDKAPKDWLGKLLALPRMLFLIIIICGILFPTGTLGYAMKLWSSLKTAWKEKHEITNATTEIVAGVRRGLNALPTTAVVVPSGFSAVVIPAGATIMLNGASVVPTALTSIDCQKVFKDALSKEQSAYTEDLVKELQKGT